MVRIGLEAGRIATAKMLEHYKRMGIEVTPQMTLAKPVRKAGGIEAGLIRSRRGIPSGKDGRFIETSLPRGW